MPLDDFYGDPADLFAALDVLLERPSWHADALCREPHYRGLPWVGVARGETSVAAARAMRDVCRRCLVRPECLADAQANPELLGMWGGLTGRERRAQRVAEAAEATEAA